MDTKSKDKQILFDDEILIAGRKTWLEMCPLLIIHCSPVIVVNYGRC